MNLVGKIFTVVIFLMCIVFASFALMVHAAHKNWRAAANEYSANLDKANKKYDELEQEKKRIENARIDDATAYKDRIVKLENTATNLTQKNLQQLGENQQLDKELRMAIQVVKSVNQNLEARVVEIDSLRNENLVAAADRQKIYNTLIHTTDEATTAKAQQQRLEGLLRDVADQNKKLKMLLDYAKIREADRDKDPPAGLTGEVTAVPRPDVVEISVGYDDGVRKGHRFSVTRPSTGKYIGDIEVIQVNYPNRAVCRPDKTMQRDQIQKGDNVQANLTKRR